MDFTTMSLEQRAVDITKLASNFPEVFVDCTGLEDASLRNELVNRFPLVEWLMSTPLSRQLLSDANADIHHFYKDTNGKWQLRTPKMIWTQAFESTQDECCWVLPDFAKCGAEVPMNLLCLKDCTEILDELIEKTVKMGSRVNVPGIAAPGDTIEDVKRRLARLTMAFLTAYNIQLGMDNTSTDILKPFHGVLQLFNNPAVVSILGTNILAAFDSLGCRLNALGDVSSYVIAIHEMGYEALLQAVVPGQNGELPAGWTKSGDELRFKGIRFLRDRFMPLDTENGTAEAWVMSGNAIGVHMGTDLAPGEDFIRYTGTEETKAKGCFNECVYYYNYGAAFNTDARKIMKIVDIPVSADCLAATSDLWNVMKPTTLIPQ